MSSSGGAAPAGSAAAGGGGGAQAQALEVEAADVVKLMLQFCKENRLLHTMRTLQDEAQVCDGVKCDGAQRTGLLLSVV